MIPLSGFPEADASGLSVLLTDIDDTLTDSGRLPAASYQALWNLAASGLKLIAVTGRPAGWCDLIVRHWPVAAVIGENGAFALYMDGETQRTIRHPAAPEPVSNAARLDAIAQEVFAEVPGTRLAKDQFCRQYDIAIDFGEEPPYLSLADAEQIREIFLAHGAQAKVSSIHVNAWFGQYDKCSMAEYLLASRFNIDINDPASNRLCLFSGDSPNDEPMFARFVHSVGVANIRQFEHTLVTPPAYVTKKPAAHGFVELADLILRYRN
jgi:HAD superfamily hydrolase (TIGR01484 family)